MTLFLQRFNPDFTRLQQKVTAHVPKRFTGRKKNAGSSRCGSTWGKHRPVSGSVAFSSHRLSSLVPCSILATEKSWS